MKIGIEAQRLFRSCKHGMDIYALELIRALQQTDHQNQYIVFVRPGNDVCLQESDNLQIWPVKAFSYADWEQIALPRAIRQAGVDLMHFTSNTASIAISCPYVLTLHDVIFLESRQGGGSLYQQAGHYYRRWNVPNVVKQAKSLLTVSNYEKFQIQSMLPGLKATVHVVYNAINAHFRPVDDQPRLREIREQYSLPEKFIFFLGNQAPKKNMLRVLQAYANYVDQESSPIKLVIAESSPEEVLTMLKEIDRPDLWLRLRLTGYIPQADLPALYTLASLFLYPSVRESFGIPIIEAMACGTPVITSATSAMPEVANGAAILINPESVDELSNAIQYAVNNRSLCQKLKFDGLARATEFSWYHTAQQTLSVYQRVLNQSMVNC